MKHLSKLGNRIGALLLSLLLLAALFGCSATLDPTPQGEIDLPVLTPGSDIDAPVFTHAPDEPIEATDEPIEATDEPTEAPTAEPTDTPCPVTEDGQYWTKDAVALQACSVSSGKYMTGSYISAHLG